MRRLLYSTIVLSTFIVAPAGAAAQVMAPPVPVVDGGPVGVAPQPQRWDWRFDAQYNSTIKPYLRWYRRGRPAIKERAHVVLMGPGASADCGCGGYSVGGHASHGQAARPHWFNPWKYLKPGEVIPPLSSTKTPSSSQTARTAAVSSTQHIVGWIHRDQKPSSKSVLFTKPKGEHADEFVQADVVLAKGRVIKIDRAYDEQANDATVLTAER